MKIKTKFDLGDNVFPIDEVIEEKQVKCFECSGRGYYETDTEKVSRCEYCYGRGASKGRGEREWRIDEDSYGFIGKISTEVYQKGYGESKCRYMLNSTGIGSGRIWDEKDLFKTIEEAQMECDKRNADDVVGIVERKRFIQDNRRSPGRM